MEHFARPASELGIPRLGNLEVAAAPSGGQGLALDEKGLIPANLLTSLLWGPIDVDPALYKSVTGAWAFGATVANAWKGGTFNSSGAQNDDISWDVALAAGTWTAELLFQKDANRGIYSVQLDGVEQGTIDSYAAAPTLNQRGSVSFVVATSSKKTLTLKMATKNGASTNYFASLQNVQLRRTA